MGRPAVLKVDIVTDAKGVGRGVDEANGKLGKLGGLAKKAGKAAALGLAVGGAAAAAFAVSAVSAASDVQQAMGGVESVFGSSAGAVKRWADQADQSVGLSKAAYGNMATILGSQLRNMGRSQAQAATQTDQLIRLGSDLAATYGGSVSDAVSAVSSLLKGETDPIERYGVSIKQSTIAADLHAKGLDKLTGKQLVQAQATSALSLLMGQTTAAHGKFAAESDTLAGQQARLSAQFENTKAALGAKLLPVVTQAAAWLNGRLLPAAARLANQLGTQLGPTLTVVGAWVTGRLVPALSQLWSWFVTKVAPAARLYITPALAGLRSMIGQVTSSLRDNQGNLSKLQHFLAVVIPPAARLAARIMGGELGLAFRVIGAIIGGVVGQIATMVGVIDSAIDRLRRLGSAVKNSPLGKVGGLLGKVGLSAPVDGMVAGPLIRRPAGGLGGPAGLATFAAGSPAGGAGGFWSAGSGLVVVDRRTIDARVIVEGDVLDGVGTAHKLDQVSRAHAQRVGRAVTFGTA